MNKINNRTFHKGANGTPTVETDMYTGGKGSSKSRSFVTVTGVGYARNALIGFATKRQDSMKKTRVLKWSLLFLCFFLTGCNAVHTRGKITEYNWVMENISNKSGKTLVSGESNSPLNELYLITLAFYKDYTFQLIDEMTNEEWKGTYTLQRTTDSFKLDMLFEGMEEAFIGTYGTRVYQDNTTVPFVLFSTDNEILSFIGKE